MTDEQKQLSRKLYDLGSFLTDMGKPDDGLIEQLCKLAGVEYPPKRD